MALSLIKVFFFFSCESNSIFVAFVVQNQTLQSSLVSPPVSLAFLHLISPPFSLSLFLPCLLKEGWMHSKSVFACEKYSFCFVVSLLQQSYYAVGFLILLFIWWLFFSFIFFLASLSSLPIHWNLNLFYHFFLACASYLCNPRAIQKCINIWKNNLSFIFVIKNLFF